MQETRGRVGSLGLGRVCFPVEEMNRAAPASGFHAGLSGENGMGWEAGREEAQERTASTKSTLLQGLPSWAFMYKEFFSTHTHTKATSGFFSLKVSAQARKEAPVGERQMKAGDIKCGGSRGLISKGIIGGRMCFGSRNPIQHRSSRLGRRCGAATAVQRARFPARFLRPEKKKNPLVLDASSPVL